MQKQLLKLKELRIENNRLTGPFKFNCKLVNKFDNKELDKNNSMQYDINSETLSQPVNIGYQETPGYTQKCVNTEYIGDVIDLFNYQPVIKYEKENPWLYNNKRLLNKEKDEELKFNYVSLINIVNIVILIYVILKNNKII